MILRYVKITQVATIALFFSLVSYNNIIDFNSNWLFVQHVLKMDTTFQSPVLMERAWQDITLQKNAYYLIIFWEILTAVVCWAGVGFLLKHVNKKAADFESAKNMAYIGLLMGFILYMVGFITVGGEWFVMWQSSTWNGQMKAGLFVTLILFVLISLQMKEVSSVND